MHVHVTKGPVCRWSECRGHIVIFIVFVFRISVGRVFLPCDMCVCVCVCMCTCTSYIHIYLYMYVYVYVYIISLGTYIQITWWKTVFLCILVYICTNTHIDFSLLKTTESRTTCNLAVKMALLAVNICKISPPITVFY